MRYVLRALIRHKTVALLIILPVALSSAVGTNAVHLARERYLTMQLKSGIADNEIVWLHSRGLIGTDASQDPEGDVNTLRKVHGVKSAAVVNTLPFKAQHWASRVWTNADSANPALKGVPIYLGTQGFLSTLGVQLVHGRDFSPDEYVDFNMFTSDFVPPVAIVSGALADRLWPNESALGKPLYLGENGAKRTQIIGVARNLASHALGTKADPNFSVAMPVHAVNDGLYVLRIDANRRDIVIQAAPDALLRTDANRIVHAKWFPETIRDYFHNDRSVILILVTVLILLLSLTALSIVALSSFWVDQRRRQIGLRRALGAKKLDILQYFMTENLLIVGTGALLGAAAALGMNMYLMSTYEFSGLPPSWAGLGALAMLLFGQCAVFGPAMRASAIPPGILTR